MGRQYLIYLEEAPLYSCSECSTHLSIHKDLISEAFRGRTGTAWLFHKVVNVYFGLVEDRVMTTGLHTIADIYCKCCNINLGWKYEHAAEQSQKYKQGKYILERELIKFTDNDQSFQLNDSRVCENQRGRLNDCRPHRHFKFNTNELSCSPSHTSSVNSSTFKMHDDAIDTIGKSIIYINDYDMNNIVLVGQVSGDITKYLDSDETYAYYWFFPPNPSRLITLDLSHLNLTSQLYERKDLELILDNQSPEEIGSDNDVSVIMNNSPLIDLQMEHDKEDQHMMQHKSCVQLATSIPIKSSSSSYSKKKFVSSLKKNFDDIYFDSLCNLPTHIHASSVLGHYSQSQYRSYPYTLCSMNNLYATQKKRLKHQQFRIRHKDQDRSNSSCSNNHIVSVLKSPVIHHDSMVHQSFNSGDYDHNQSIQLDNVYKNDPSVKLTNQFYTVQILLS